VVCKDGNTNEEAFEVKFYQGLNCGSAKGDTWDWDAEDADENFNGNIWAYRGDGKHGYLKIEDQNID